MRLEVTCFAEFMDFGGAQPPSDFRIVQPWLSRGCRWGWPGRCLAWQVRRQVKRDRPDFLFVCSLTRLTRHLLQTDLADQLLIWESTNANPGNKFVDIEASRMLGRARAVLSPSVSIDQNIRQNYGNQGRILRLPFWIEDRPGACASPPAEVLADFIYLGRRDVEKGLREMIAATAVVKRSFPTVKVLIAGSGSADAFAGLAGQLGVSDNLAFRFFPSREETLRALADSRWLVLPSYHEGYPLVLLEAAQCGVPFIATRVGSVPELYGDSAAALLVPPKDTTALADAMVRAMTEERQLYMIRRASAHEIFQRLSSSQAVAGALRAVLADLEVARNEPALASGTSSFQIHKPVRRCDPSDGPLRDYRSELSKPHHGSL